MKNRCFYLLAIFFVIASVSTYAQNTAAKAGTVSDVRLLEGHWLGTFNGGPIEAVWSAPVGDNIVGFIRMTMVR